MSLDHILASLGLPHRDPNSLEARLEALQREIRHIGRSVSRHASHAAGDWGDQLSELSQEAAQRGMQLAEIAGTQAKRSARAVRHDPLPAIAVVGTVLLLARLLRR